MDQMARAKKKTRRRCLATASPARRCGTAQVAFLSHGSFLTEPGRAVAGICHIAMRTSVVHQRDVREDEQRSQDAALLNIPDIIDTFS